jgi:transposase
MSDKIFSTELWWRVSTIDLTDAQWDVLKPSIPVPRCRTDGRGRPWRDSRTVLNGILWILRTGAQWQDWPPCYPPYQTCHRRFQSWVRSGVFERILQALASDLRERGELDLSERFIDGTFVVAKKGSAGWERPSGARVRRSWPWQTVLVNAPVGRPGQVKAGGVPMAAAPEPFGDLGHVEPVRSRA